MNNEPSGVRLMRLINTRSLEIAKRENRNDSKMCLYGTGGYWTGFERSAYFLSRIFPGLESFMVRNPDYPYAIVGMSISDTQLKQYMNTHGASHQLIDYVEFDIIPCKPQDYSKWHNKKVKYFTDAIN